MHIMKWKIKKKSLKIITLITVFTLSCAMITKSGTGTYTYAFTADDYENKIEQLVKENEEIEKKLSGIDSSLHETEEYLGLVSQKLNNTKEEIDYLNNKIYYKTLEIEGKQEEISEIETQIATKENDIEAKKIRIVNLETENKENIEKFGDIIAAMYKSDNQDVVSVLAGATDFYDLLVRAKLLSNVAEQNDAFMESLLAEINNLKTLNTELENDIVRLSDDKTQLEAEKSQLIREKSELEADSDKSTQLSVSYMMEYNSYESTMTSLEKEAQKYEYQRELNANEINDYEAKIAAIIKAAQLGEEYIEGDWLWPLDEKYQLITTYFGYDPWRGGSHGGIDIGNAGIGGANIYAAKSGTVIVAENNYIPGYSYGKYIVVDHGGGVTTLYAHCNTIYVTAGQKVSAGDVIGAVGTTGWSTGNHLHFEIRKDSVRQDPLSDEYVYYYY